MTRNLVRLILFGVILFRAVSAHAESLGVAIKVGAIVVGHCRITVNDVSFGAYDPLGLNALTQLDTTSRLSVLCTKDALATVALDGGMHPVQDRRQMALAGFRLSYDLFRDEEHRTKWSEGELSMRVIGTGNINDPQELVVYGRIPAGQAVPAGTYFDVITARVDF